MAEPTYDLFILHADADRAWVDRYLRYEVGVEPDRLITRHEFKLGAVITDEFERAVVQSRYTVGVLSPNYLKSNFTDLEGILAEHIGLEESQQRFIGVMRESCKPRLGIRARFYLDMTDEDEFEPALARLVAQIRQPPDAERTEA